MIVANPLNPKVADEAMVMGPVISAKSKQYILEMIETGVKEGATLAVDGRDITVPGCENGYFVGHAVFTDVKPGMEIHSTEIFGPVVVVLKVDALDEAIEIIDDHQYGNGASISSLNPRSLPRDFGRRTAKTKKLEINGCSWYCVNSKASRIEQFEWSRNPA